MLIWANKKEVNQTLINPLSKMYGKKLDTWNFGGILKSWELSIILRQIRRHFGYKKGISILDFGTGRSPFPAYLNHIGYKDVTCFDHPRGRYRGIDERTYNASYGSHVIYIKDTRVRRSLGRFDVIYSASVLEHITDKNERILTLKRLARHLKPGGLFIHVIDYKEIDGKPVGIKSVKKLIDQCDVEVSYDRNFTPGCRQFEVYLAGVWWVPCKGGRMTRIAFFNEKKK